MLCEGRTGDGRCIADIVEAADCPEDGVGKGCGLAVEIAETGSALEGGQSPLAGFFLGPHPPWSPFAAGASPFVWGGAWGAESVVDEDDVEELDEFEAIDDEESFRSGTFRGWNMRETSSAFIELNPPCPSTLFHLGKCCRLVGDTTAVICVMLPDLK